MGCVHSKTDINDIHPNVFQVINVDDLGNHISPGRLEVTESDIILYRRNKLSIRWPLRCLRRYGYDAEIFSFESGRRCSTGAGIYAFKCNRAAQLFNLVQANIQGCNNVGDDFISRELPLDVHPGTTTRLTIQSQESNYLDPTPVRNNGHIITSFPHDQQNRRLSSISSSNEPLSPQSIINSPALAVPSSLPPPPPISQSVENLVSINNEFAKLNSATSLEANNNKDSTKELDKTSVMQSHKMHALQNIIGEAISQEKTIETTTDKGLLSSPSYMNIDLNSDVSSKNLSNSGNELATTKIESGKTDLIESHAYINVNVGKDNSVSFPSIKPRPPSLLSHSIPYNSDESIRHCYANLESSGIELLKKRFSTSSMLDKSPTSTPTTLSTVSDLENKGVSYAILDLNSKDSITDEDAAELTEIVDSPPSIPPHSPNKSQQLGYAIIDFNKTAALSQSAHSYSIPDADEGSRRTRHNSTIGELANGSKQSVSMSE